MHITEKIFMWFSFCILNTFQLRLYFPKLLTRKQKKWKEMKGNEMKRIFYYSTNQFNGMWSHSEAALSRDRLQATVLNSCTTIHHYFLQVSHMTEQSCTKTQNPQTATCRREPWFMVRKLSYLVLRFWTSPVKCSTYSSLTEVTGTSGHCREIYRIKQISWEIH